MSEYLRPEEFLSYAKSLRVGATAKFRHTCGSRESMVVANTAVDYWAYCHRCHRSGRLSKQYNFNPVPTPPVPRHPPTDLRKLTPQDFKEFGQRRLAYDRWLVNHISLLEYSPQFKRVYMPSSKPEWLGYDVTGQAQASWYATCGRPILGVLETECLDVIRFVDNAEDYLKYYRTGLPVVGAIVRRVSDYLAVENELLRLRTKTVLTNNERFTTMQRELRVHNIEVLYDQA